jgi:hypothetical protein
MFQQPRSQAAQVLDVVVQTETLLANWRKALPVEPMFCGAAKLLEGCGSGVSWLHETWQRVRTGPLQELSEGSVRWLTGAQKSSQFASYYFCGWVQISKTSAPPIMGFKTGNGLSPPPRGDPAESPDQARLCRTRV